jgi:hypothetical protein
MSTTASAIPDYGTGLNDNLQSLAYVVSNILFVIGTLSIMLRIYSRALVVRIFGWDDWIMTSIFV